MKSYIVISGVPGSGKSTVARAIAKTLGWEYLDKDDFLEKLFRKHGCADSNQRQLLSREADVQFERSAKEFEQAILDSFWRAPGSRSSSGSPSDWLISSEIRVLEVVCRCSAETAATRFLSRNRHAGHFDHYWTKDKLVLQSHKIESKLPLSLGGVLEYNSSNSVGLDRICEISKAWAAA